MIQAAKIIGTATIGITGAGFGIFFGSFLGGAVFLMAIAIAVWHLSLIAVPGVKCPVCLEEHGKVVWVIPGKNCPQCGHPCG